MYAQQSGFRPYQPSSFSVHPQTGPWKVDPANNVSSAEDQYFVKQFERNILATKTRPTVHVNAVKVRFVYNFLLKNYNWCSVKDFANILMAL